MATVRFATGKAARRGTIFATAVVVLALSVPAAAHADAPAEDSTGGRPGSPGLGDPVFPRLGNGGYQVDAYLPDMAYSADTRTVDATVTLVAEATQHLSRFNLDSVGLDIHSVEVNNTPAEYAARGEELVITPSRSLPDRSRFLVTIDYTADPRMQVPNPGWVPTDDGFALAPQPAGGHSIFPSNDHPSDKANYVFRVTAPEGTIGVANGTKVGEEPNSDGSTTSTFVSRHPIATELVQVAVGDYTVVERGQHDGAQLRDVVPTDRLDRLEPALALTPGQLNWAKRHFGRFPLEAYGLLPVNTDDPNAFDFTGLETQTLTLYKPDYLEQAEPLIGSHMMHEIVHNWFGNSVTPKDWSALWINEGHANYYGLRYRYYRGWPDDYGFTTFLRRMKHTYQLGDIWRQESGPVASPNEENLFDDQRYNGGALVLFALREKLGIPTFKTIEQQLIHRYRDKTVSTEDFIALAAKVSGDPSVVPFLRDWLYGMKTPPMPNHPDWTVDPPDPKAKVDVQHDRYDL